MFAMTARFVVLALGVAIVGTLPSGAQANDLSEACRSSAYRADGAVSEAPDICAVIETATVNGNERSVDTADAIDVLATAMDKADFVLLGEVHDNPSHHRIRGQLILAIAARRLTGKRRAPGLVLEHIRADQALAVMAFRAADRVQRRTTDELFAALDWASSGWPDAALFKPMLTAALDAEWPLLHGNVTRESIRSVARGGIAALDPAEVQRLGLGNGLPDAAQSALLDELVGSHCGLMQRSALSTMADAQRYRDAYMAAQLIDAAKTYDGAVLLAGNGHVQRDRGVPWHLARMAPEKRSIVVLFAQARPDPGDAKAYVERSADGASLGDFVVVTPRVERPDPCEAMRKRFSAPPKGRDRK